MYPGVGEQIEKPDERRPLGKVTLTGGRSRCWAFQRSRRNAAFIAHNWVNWRVVPDPNGERDSCEGPQQRDRQCHSVDPSSRTMTYGEPSVSDVADAQPHALSPTVPRRIACAGSSGESVPAGARPPRSSPKRLRRFLGVEKSRAVFFKPLSGARRESRREW